VRNPKLLKMVIKEKNENVNYNTEEMMNSFSSKQMMDILFHDLNKRLRPIVEHEKANVQCKKTIGECKEPCICWICGFPIMYKDKKHCDHILPIMYAIMLSAISTNKTTQTRIDENNPNFLNEHMTLNYDYAHDTCNIIKSNLLLIKWNNENHAMEYDEHNGNILANKITDLYYNTKDENYKPYYQDLQENFKEKINRLLPLINNEINAISSVVGGNMDIYWKYAIEIMKLYVNTETLNQYGKLDEYQLSFIKKVLNNEEINEMKLIDVNAPENIKKYKNKMNEILESLKRNMIHELNMEKINEKQRPPRKTVIPQNKTKNSPVPSTNLTLTKRKYENSMSPKYVRGIHPELMNAPIQMKKTKKNESISMDELKQNNIKNEFIGGKRRTYKKIKKLHKF